MSRRDFLDTNILVYAFDVADPHKQKTAKALLARAVVGEFAVSIQVLAELASILIEKYKYEVARVITILESLRPIPLIQPDADMVRRAVEARGACGVHFYDGMIIAAAERAGSTKIWSEDLSPGQKYFGVEVVNPFT